MRGVIFLAVGVLVVGFFASQFSKMVRAKMDITDQVERQLDFVDDQSIESVKDDLVKEADKAGVALNREKVLIVYRDTDQQLYEQRVLGKIAQFKNKQVGISVNYQWRILGFGIAQDITRTKIKQIQVRQKELPAEYQELLK